MRKFEGILGFLVLPFFYGGFVFSVTFWLIQKEKFWGVESWPKVEAKILEHGSGSTSYRLETRTGTRMGSVGSSWIVFEYWVGSKRYESSLGSPNGGGLPTRFDFGQVREGPWNESWDAYYKPDSPEVAVLLPVAYKGQIWLIIAAVCVCPVGIHSFFWVRNRVRPDGELRQLKARGTSY